LARERVKCCAASNRMWSPMVIRPESGLVNPATQSSTVVFPAPDGPNRMVNPGAARNSASRTNSCPGAANRLRNPAASGGPGVLSSFSFCAGADEETAIAVGSSVRRSLISAELFCGSDDPHLPVHTVNEGQHGKAEHQQQHSFCIRLSFFGGLEPSEDVDES